MRFLTGFFCFALLAGGVLSGCVKGAEQQKAPETTEATNAGETFVILKDTVLTLAPSEAEAVPHPKAGPQIMVQNVVGHLFRGRLGVAGKSQVGYTWIKLDDDAEGWVRTADIAPVKGLNEATLLEDTPVYRGPAESQSQLAGTAVAGELLYIMEAGTPMSKVHMEDLGVVWVPSKALVRDDIELGMAHLIIHSKMYARAHDYGEVAETLDEARIKYPTSQLMNVIAEMVNINSYHPTPAMPTSRMQQSGQY